jgi:hypothetical protein
MKKLLILAAAIAGAVFAINQKKQQEAKPDPWSEASDSV